MRTTKSLSVGAVVAICALAFGMTGVARADVSTERPGSILIFPKVVNTTDQDTVIQITNTSTSTTHARCFYIDGSPDPNTGQPRWQESDFQIWLTRLQPTHFLASEGRQINPLDSNTGFDPGAVPPTPPGFTGQLICATVDESDVPIPGNSLIGQATVKNINLNPGDVSKYNAISIHGGDPVSGNALVLDNTQYNGCPASLNFTTLATGAADPVVEDLGVSGSSITNFITLIPCSADLENLVPATVSLSVVAYNEFEQQISFAGAPGVECWTRVPLTSIGAFAFSSTSTDFVYGTITPQGANASAGVLAVLDSVVTDGAANSASAANNVHVAGNTDTTNLPVVTGSPAVIRLSTP